MSELPELPTSETTPQESKALVSWDEALVRAKTKLLLLLLSAISLGTVVWAGAFPAQAGAFFFEPTVISDAGLTARRTLLVVVAVVASMGLVPAARVAGEALRGRTVWPIHWELFAVSLLAVPLLRTPGVEFDHPMLTAVAVASLSLGVGQLVAALARRLPSDFDLSPRAAWALVGLGFCVFVGAIGFISHWRHITFHSEPCDMTWEVGAVAGILRHGIPTVSVAAWFYDGQPLPAPYFNVHVPLVDYLFVPFYALYRHAVTILWLQAAFMGVGAFGAFLLGRSWLTTRLGGVLFAFLYLANPNIQGLCLHDVHANIFVIPALFLAAGFMSAERPRLALLFALLGALCREETPVYVAGLGLFWMFSGGGRAQFRYGLLTCVVTVVLAVFFSSYLMPKFGGEPRWGHFQLFFDRRQSPLSIIGALLLNPIGSLFFTANDPIKLEYLVISLVPFGGLAAVGWRSGWFLLPALLLLVPSHDPAFFALGINYSAPLVPAALLMGLSGFSRVWHRTTASSPGRSALVGYVLASALAGNYLYGNIAAKSYKLEYGQAPYRHQNQRDYRDLIGYVDRLPPFGPTQKRLWEVLDRVPPDASVLSSWSINAQLAEHDVSLVFGYSGGRPAPEERVDYVVIDKLPPLVVATEPEIQRFRSNRKWSVFYENEAGIIFKRKTKKN